MNLFMKKYRALAATALKETFMWREHLLVWIVISFLEIGVYPFVLFAAYGGAGEINGFTRPMLVTYYFFLPIISGVTISYVWDEIKNDIRDGKLSNWLVKPVDILSAYFWNELGHKCIRALLTMIPMAVIFPFVYRSVRFPMPDWHMIFFPAVVCLSIVVTFLLAALMGIAAAWTTQVDWILHAWFITYTFAAGIVAPYALYPEWLQTILHYSPFPLLTQIPLGLLLQTVSVGEVIEAVVIGLGWLAVLWGINRLVWRRALWRVEGVGM